MSRYQPLLIGMLAAVLVSALTFGSVMFIPLLLPVVAVGLAWARWGSGRVLADGRWTTTVIHDTVPPELSESVRQDATPGAIVRSLGAVEGRHLALSGWFGAGLGLCVMTIALLVGVWGGENFDSWQETLQYSSWFVHPLTGFVVIAAHRAVTRARRDHAEELFDTCATSPSTRTAGFLASAWTPAIAGFLFFAAMTIGTAWRNPGVHGPIGLDGVADVLASLALPVGGVALGVALGRWVPFSLAPIVAVVGVGFATIAINQAGSPGWNPFIALSTAPNVEESTPVFAARAAWWHLVWIIGLIALMCVIAIARSRRDGRVLAAGAIAIAVMATAGIAATRPMSASAADRIAGLVAQPEDHQECRDIDGRVAVCVFAVHAELLDGTVETITPVAAALPASVGPLTVRQVYDGDLERLPPKVRDRLTAEDLVRPPDEVPLSYGDGGFETPRNLALHAVGLPTSPDGQQLPLVVAGEARGVVALWLATRGLGDGEVREATTAENSTSTDAFDRGNVARCSTPPVVWSAQDLTAARALIGLDEESVKAVIGDDWDRWTDPETSTDELMAAVGLDPVGPFDHVVARPDAENC